MSSLEELTRGTKVGRTGSMDMIVVRGIIDSILKFLTKELPGMKLNVQSDDATGLSRDLMTLNRQLMDLTNTLDKKDSKINDIGPMIVKALEGLKVSLGDVKIPDMPKFPATLDLGPATVKALQVKPESINIPDTVKINNLGEVVNALEDLKSAVMSAPMVDTVKISNLKDIKVKPAEFKLPKIVVDALMKLNMLSKDAKNYITVRLSDGDKWANLIGQQVRTAVAMHPIPGNVVRSGLISGAKELTSATVAVQITETETPISRVAFTVLDGLAAIGDVNANVGSGTEQGNILYPGNKPTEIFIDDLSKVYAAGAAGVRIAYVYYA